MQQEFLTMRSIISDFSVKRKIELQALIMMVSMRHPIWINEDIKAAFEASLLGSALEHFINFGQFESRPGTKISSNVYTLTRRFDEFEGGLGDDKFLADPLTLDVDDILNGRGGVDTLELSFNSLSWTDLTLPESDNFSILKP